MTLRVTLTIDIDPGKIAAHRDSNECNGKPVKPAHQQFQNRLVAFADSSVHPGNALNRGGPAAEISKSGKPKNKAPFELC